MYDRESLQVSWIYSIADTDEVAVTSLRITGAAFDAVAALGGFSPGADGGACMTAMHELLNTAGLHWATYSQLTDVKVAALGTDGAYLTDAVIWTPPTADVGIVNAVLPQSSVVGSLRSSTTLGAANYGRMYLPHTKLEVAAGKPSASTGVTSSVVAGFKLFIDAINTTFNTGAEPGIVSIMSSKGVGLTKPVTRVAIGTVTDTQRRRRNRLVEDYSFAGIAP